MDSAIVILSALLCLSLIIIIILACMCMYYVKVCRFEKKQNKVAGVLRIDDSDTECEPYVFLELTDDPINLRKYDKVTFKVNTENYIAK